MTTWPLVVSSIGSAAAFAVATTLKHRSAGQTPSAQDLRPRHVARFVRATVAHPLWLGGIAADVVGLGLQVYALHIGALAVVQPLLVSGLLFALLLRQGSERRISRSETGWAAVLTAALAGFVLLAGTSSQPNAGPDQVDRGPAILAGVIGVVLAVVCVLLGRRQGASGRRAALLGVAVGTTYAATAALIKGLSDVMASHLLSVFTAWQLYALVVVGALGLLLNQLAFQAGPLSASLPATATVDPLLSILIGVVIYDEHIRRGPLAGSGLVLTLAILGLAVMRLARLEHAAPE